MLLNTSAYDSLPNKTLQGAVGALKQDHVLFLRVESKSQTPSTSNTQIGRARGQWKHKEKWVLDANYGAEYSRDDGATHQASENEILPAPFALPYGNDEPLFCLR